MNGQWQYAIYGAATSLVLTLLGWVVGGKLRAHFGKPTLTPRQHWRFVPHALAWAVVNAVAWYFVGGM